MNLSLQGAKHKPTTPVVLPEADDLTGEEMLLQIVCNWQKLRHSSRAAIFHYAWRNISRRHIFYTGYDFKNN
jgi:hypothetical protein